MNRIFISYRSADAKKDANRLAEDLNRVFGDEQVFFDKHDLQGGVAWRSAIGEALGQRPVVLLLMTPELVGAAHPEGGRRIDHSDDPIRMELIAARGHDALIVPLLTEGMVMPAAAALPGELRFLAEAHALKLRTDDWAHDLGRLIADLVRHGIKPRPGAWSPGGGGGPATPAALRTTWIVFWAAVVLWVLVVANVEAHADEDTYIGAGVMIVVVAGMFVAAFRGFRRVGHGARWFAISFAVLCGVMAIGAFGNAVRLGETGSVGAYRPPVTSITAPVV